MPAAAPPERRAPRCTRGARLGASRPLHPAAAPPRVERSAAAWASTSCRDAVFLLFPLVGRAAQNPYHIFIHISNLSGSSHKSDPTNSANRSRDKPNTTCRAGNDGFSVKLAERHSGNHLSTVFGWTQITNMMHLSPLLMRIVHIYCGSWLGL